MINKNLLETAPYVAPHKVLLFRFISLYLKPRAIKSHLAALTFRFELVIPTAGLEFNSTFK